MKQCPIIRGACNETDCQFWSDDNCLLVVGVKKYLSQADAALSSNVAQLLVDEQDSGRADQTSLSTIAATEQELCDKILAFLEKQDSRIEDYDDPFSAFLEECELPGEFDMTPQDRRLFSRARVLVEANQKEREQQRIAKAVGAGQESQIAEWLLGVSRERGMKTSSDFFRLAREFLAEHGLPEHMLKREHKKVLNTAIEQATNIWCEEEDARVEELLVAAREWMMTVGKTKMTRADVKAFLAGKNAKLGTDNVDVLYSRINTPNVADT